jgi:predicted nucleotidyltransferase
MDVTSSQHTWLDEETSALVRDTLELLAQRHPEVLAIILYGSVARHEERSLDRPAPSDVDLLVVVNGNRDAVRSQMLALVHTADLAEDRHLGAPREVKVLFSSRTSQEWVPDFIANAPMSSAMAESSIGAESFLPLSPPESSY